MKKLYERAVVEAFLRWKGLPLSALEDSERERPDALIRVDERPVGVEVTTLTEAILDSGSRLRSGPSKQYGSLRPQGSRLSHLILGPSLFAFSSGPIGSRQTGARRRFSLQNLPQSSKLPVTRSVPIQRHL